MVFLLPLRRKHYASPLPPFQEPNPLGHAWGITPLHASGSLFATTIVLYVVLAMFSKPFRDPNFFNFRIPAATKLA